MKELTNVLKKLKNEKARDPHGFINKIFKPGVAGNNLIEGLLMLVNEVKNQQKIPDIFQFANITSFFKGKGNKFEMDNDKGVFGATIFRYIIDKLIYNQEYKNMEKCFMCFLCVSGHSEYFLFFLNLLRGWEKLRSSRTPPCWEFFPSFTFFF